ncbi:MAG TPA: hypothetical protein VK906_01245 [Egicoccus sp.]|nr:hypothetical protein [Egicoccus sp.]HSK21764.1 hypothetical protein [Egicoccus sp.]
MSSDRSAPDVSYDELLATMPPELHDALVTVPWKLERLHRLDLRVQHLAVADLLWLLDLPLWQRDGVRFQVRPLEVLARPALYPHHMARILAADLTYPIHVAVKSQRTTVLDGFHRLTKAHLEGRSTIAVMRLSPDDLRAVCG